MSNAFYHYKQRCDDLERALVAMTAERDQYFNMSEHFRCAPTVNDDDALLPALRKALDGLQEVTLPEAIAAMGLHEPTREIMVCAGRCLRKLGWSRYEQRSGGNRFIYRRNSVQLAA